MPKPLKLSIVIPSFNHGEYLHATLDSLFSQQNVGDNELEVIVIDGGSKDDTAEILRLWSHRLAYWISEPDEGQTDALIKGFNRCTGDIMGWLCSDDLLQPWAAREVLDQFTEFPSVRFLYGDALWITRTGSYLRSKKEIPFSWFIWLHDHNYIPQPSAFWHRSLYEEVGGLDPCFDLAMDGDLFARFAQISPPKHVPRQWSLLRSYPEQKNKRLREQSDREDLLIRTRMGVNTTNHRLVAARRYLAKAFRVAWRLSVGGYRRCPAHLLVPAASHETRKSLSQLRML